MQARLGSQLAHPRQLLDHFQRRAPHVGQAMGGADRDRRDNTVGAGLQRIAAAAQVRRQDRDHQVGVTQGMGHHFPGIGHLRQQSGRHEGRDFHMANAGGIGRIDPLALGGGRHDGMQALQTIAHADFVDRYCCHEVLSQAEAWAQTRETAWRRKDVIHGLIHRQPRWMDQRADWRGGARNSRWSSNRRADSDRASRSRTQITNSPSAQSSVSGMMRRSNSCA
ncbi:hypothetical protein D3C84_738520 [compost metagenome]